MKREGPDRGRGGNVPYFSNIPRVLGEYSTGTRGPLVVVFCGVHGNEPAGVIAARRVLEQLEYTSPRMRGTFVALSGNRAALALGARYVERDFNRIWSTEELAVLEDQDPDDDTFERREQRQLVAALERWLDRDWSRVYMIDLHSTSAAGAPFSIIKDRPEDLRIALSMQAPVLLGFEASIHGTLLEYFARAGHVAIGLEGGQHDAPETVEHHESALWLALEEAGLLDADDVPDLAAHRERMRAAATDIPPGIEIWYRESLDPRDEFEMRPGYRNFQPVREGELLAHSGPDGTREVRAPADGILVMPRYQGQGLDGFFLGRRIELGD